MYPTDLSMVAKLCGPSPAQNGQMGSTGLVIEVVINVSLAG